MKLIVCLKINTIFPPGNVKYAENTLKRDRLGQHFGRQGGTRPSKGGSELLFAKAQEHGLLGPKNAARPHRQRFGINK
jgi:hypothetical protein